MEKEKTKNSLGRSFRNVLSIKKKIQLGITLLAAVVILCGISYIAGQVNHNNSEKAKIVTESTLEKIVSVSELSTFTAVYNGIAEVTNEDNPEKIDYYVSYNARVKAGLDFKNIKFTIDDQEKVIHASLPPIRINDITVDMASLDFIFYNKKKNSSTVSEEAYKACIADVQTESAKQNAILESAKENAENVIEALIAPITKQDYPTHAISMEWEAEQ